MWWNFIGRTHEEVVAYRAAWQAEIDAEPARAPEDGTYDDGTPYPRFGPYPAGQPAPLPAPTLPTVQLRPTSMTDASFNLAIQFWTNGVNIALDVWFVLVLGWGSTYGPIAAATRLVRATGARQVPSCDIVGCRWRKTAATVPSRNR